MKPFNLERAKAGDPIVARDGRNVKFIAHVPEALDGYRVVCLLNNFVLTFHDNGVFDHLNPGTECNNLFMAPKKITVWQNWYRRKDGTPVPLGKIGASREKAEEYAKISLTSYIGTFPTEIEVP